MRIGLGLAAAAAVWTLAASAEAATVAVSADRLLDVASGKYVDKPLVVIVDGRISAVEHQGDQVPAGAQRVDLPGVTLLPGLIDMHVHLTSSPLFGGYNRLQMTDGFWPIHSGTTHAKATVEAGFTTVRNVGSRNFEDVGLKQAIDAGFIPGPRIVPAGYAIGSTGGHYGPNSFPPSMKQHGDAVIDSPDEGRKRVREMHKYGAQVIKICATGGVFSHGDTPGAQQLTLEEIKAMVDEAHRGRHTGSPPAPRRRRHQGRDPGRGRHYRARQHGGRRGHPARHRPWQLLRHGHLQHRLHPGRGQEERGAGGEPAEGPRHRRDQRENFRKALKTGVKMIFSTDAGVYPHGTNARQFAVMVRYGATPLQAIRTATLTAAEALDRVKDVGQGDPPATTAIWWA